jgi:hypothetical protein
VSDRLDFRQGQLFHMTTLDHLPSIVADGRLLCDVALEGRDPGGPSIGHSHMKEKRRRIEVPVPPGGVVGNYVPFYLAPRSPMLYANHMGAVKGRNGGQTGIVYLVTSLERVMKLRGAIATNKHPERRPQFTDDLTHVTDPDFIDWEVMFDPDFRPREDYTDRKDRRQAEVLVHGEVPLGTFVGLAARTEPDLAAAQELCEAAFPSWHFKVRADWYF